MTSLDPTGDDATYLQAHGIAAAEDALQGAARVAVARVPAGLTEPLPLGLVAEDAPAAQERRVRDGALADLRTCGPRAPMFDAFDGEPD